VPPHTCAVNYHEPKITETHLGLNTITLRKIIHIDADAFYASVEEREDPALKSQAIAVGGSPEGRGVVATCNYRARSFGVHSAMPSSQAIKLCPELIFLKPRFDLYREASKQMHHIFKQYTELVEPLSLDEAYLDVSSTIACKGSATLIAQEIQAKILQSVGISVSAGVAPNKFLAKIASDWNKPHGLFVILPEHIEDFVKALPVKKINGVGKVTEEKMRRLGIATCDDLRTFSELKLTQHFGKYGQRLYQLARGTDERMVQVSRERKSLSVETTFEQNIQTLDQLINQSKSLYEQLITRSDKLKDSQSISGRYIKLKFSDFTQTTLEESLSGPTQNWKDPEVFEQMLTKAWSRHMKPVRLAGLGVKISNQRKSQEQLDLFQQIPAP
jgi:DNA polymerase IV